MANKGDTWFRYEDRRYSIPDDYGGHAYTRVEIAKSTFVVSKVTPKGVWLQSSNGMGLPWPYSTARFVKMDARKRYAHPTEKEALESLLARKHAQQRILASQLAKVDQAVLLTQQMLGRHTAANDGSLAILG